MFRFRVVSYNLLADIYSDSDYARDVLFSYCPPYALDMDYRRQVLLKEITGMIDMILSLVGFEYYGDFGSRNLKKMNNLFAKMVNLFAIVKTEWRYNLTESAENRKYVIQVNQVIVLDFILTSSILLI